MATRRETRTGDPQKAASSYSRPDANARALRERDLRFAESASRTWNADHALHPDWRMDIKRPRGGSRG